MNWRAFLAKYGVLVAFIMLFAFMAINKPDFLQPENLRNLFNQNAAVGLMSVGMTLVIMTGGIDLSVASLAVFVGSVILTVINRQVDGGAGESAAVSVAIVAGVALSCFFGLVNGLVVVYGRVASFITTLVGLLAFRSAAMAVAGGGEIRSSSREIYPVFGNEGVPISFIQSQSGPLKVTWAMLTWMLLSVLASFLLNMTAFGRHVIAIGSNERAAIYSGVPVKRTKLLAYVFSGFCVSLAAIFLTSRLNSVATGSLAQNLELDAIAAVVIGGTSLRGGTGRLWGTFVGVLLLGLITTMLVYYNVSPHLQGIVKGVIILIAVLLQRGTAND